VFEFHWCGTGADARWSSDILQKMECL